MPSVPQESLFLNDDPSTIEPTQAQGIKAVLVEESHIVSCGLFRNTVLGLGYVYAEDNENGRHTLMAQLAWVFQAG